MSRGYDLEDGMGFSGLVPTKAERKREEWEAAQFRSLSRRIEALEQENARLREMLGMRPQQ